MLRSILCTSEVSVGLGRVSSLFPLGGCGGGGLGRPIAKVVTIVGVGLRVV